jgi:hypothetical protein
MYLTAAPGGAPGVRVARRQRGKPLPNGITVRMGELWERGDVGVMVTPASGQRMHLLAPLVPFFAFDTGNYTRPVALDDYLCLLRDHQQHRQRFLFATAPDVVGDAAATWALSAPALPQIRAFGYPAALVAQDGLEATAVPWDAFDVLFVGGTTDWKLTVSPSLVRAAVARGVPVHMGRVNSWKRIRWAAELGCASADGTCLAFNPPQYVREIAAWLDRLERLRTGPRQLSLFAEESSW